MSRMRMKWFMKMTKVSIPTTPAKKVSRLLAMYLVKMPMCIYIVILTNNEVLHGNNLLLTRRGLGASRTKGPCLLGLKTLVGPAILLNNSYMGKIMRKLFFFYVFLSISVLASAQGQILLRTGARTTLQEATAESVYRAVGTEVGLRGLALLSREIRPVSGKDLLLVADEPVAAETKRLLQKSIRQEVVRKYVFSAIERNMPHSLLRVVVVNEEYTETASSGFVFEESSSGKKKTWAVVVHHSAPVQGAEILLQAHRTDGRKETFKSTVAVTGRGGHNGVDIALAEIPSELARYLRPLRWSEKAPIAGQRVDSYGFNSREMWPQSFNKTENRKILDVTGLKITTSYNFRIGQSSRACGSPLLDRNGEVVGVHIGSSPTGDASFALTREAVQDALKAYYTGHAYRALKINGQSFGSIDFTERIKAIKVMRTEYAYSINIDNYRGPFDYQALETMYAFKSGDGVEVAIEAADASVRKVSCTVD